MLDKELKALLVAADQAFDESFENYIRVTMPRSADYALIKDSNGEYTTDSTKDKYVSFKAGFELGCKS